MNPTSVRTTGRSVWAVLGLGILLIATAAAFFATTGSATAATRHASCHGQRATIVGTAGANKIHGTAHRDIIQAKGGNDDIEGRGGNDLICGGRGHDELEGGRGNDNLFGGVGRDECEGGPGRDRTHSCRVDAD